MHIWDWLRFERKENTPSKELRTAIELKESQYAAALAEANKKLDALSSMYERGYLLLGIESVTSGIHLAIAVRQICKRQLRWYLEIEMYSLPFVQIQQRIGHMDVCLFNGGTAELVDWDVQNAGQGYGSIFIKYVLSFLRTIGYDYFVGKILPRDYDHLDLLLHFYQKFGFEITPKKDCYALKLFLLPDSKYHAQSMAKDNAYVGHGIGGGEAEIKLRPLQIRLNVGQQAELTPEICLAHHPIDSATFFSQDPQIAAIDDSGTITAVSPGTTDVFYQCGEVGAYCQVTVADSSL